MSDQYDNTDKGVLFKNDKEGNEKRPDYKGSINVGGVDYWLSAWIRTSKAGSKYMSLAVKPKDAARAPVQNDFDARYPSEPKAPAVPVPAVDDFDDEIPFG